MRNLSEDSPELVLVIHLMISECWMREMRKSLLVCVNGWGTLRVTLSDLYRYLSHIYIMGSKKGYIYQFKTYVQNFYTVFL